MEEETDRHALEEIGMEADELVRLLLDDLGPHGRPEVAAGTDGHPAITHARQPQHAKLSLGMADTPPQLFPRSLICARRSPPFPT